MACLKIVLVLTIAFMSRDASANVTSRGLSCLPLWTRFQDHCYRFFGVPMSWEDAEFHCREFIGYYGDETTGHVVSIHSQEENSFVYTLWQSSMISGLDEQCPRFATIQIPNRVWIGLEDRDTEGSFVWSDGTALDFSLWTPSQPDNSGGEDCGHIWKRPSGNTRDKWNDMPCSVLVPSVCKMPIS